MVTGAAIRTLDDVRGLLKDIPGADETAAQAAAERELRLTKPEGALGRLEELSAWLATWQGRHPPVLERPKAIVFAGNHGVTDRGVSAFPAEVTLQMVANFEAGGAAVNQLCRTFGAGLAVVPMDLERPTRDFTNEPAMSETECAEAITAGMEAVDGNTDVLCLGEMGIGNTTSAAAVCHALFGGGAALWTGPGTGVEDEALDNKIQVVAESKAVHDPDLTDGLEVLRCLGGRELAAIAGAVIAARRERVPVLLDGYACTAAAAVLEACMPGALDHCVVAHASAEPGHRLLLEKLGKAPLFDLGMRLGEASGAVLALAVLKAAVACHTGMATFGEAGISGRSSP